MTTFDDYNLIYAETPHDLMAEIGKFKEKHFDERWALLGAPILNTNGPCYQAVYLPAGTYRVAPEW